MPAAQLPEVENPLAVAARVKRLEVERKKIEASRVKCEQEIQLRVEELQKQAALTGKTLLEEARALHDQHLDSVLQAEVVLKDTGTSPPTEFPEVRLVVSPLSNFPPSLGFLTTYPLLPSELHLLPNSWLLRPGTFASCSITAMTQKALPELLLKNLVVTVSVDHQSLQVEQQLVDKECCLLLNFTTLCEGQHRVSVMLNMQHIQGSPLLLPVVKDLATALAQLGLQPLAQLGIQPLSQGLVQLDIQSQAQRGLQPLAQPGLQSLAQPGLQSLAQPGLMPLCHQETAGHVDRKQEAAVRIPSSNSVTNKTNKKNDTSLEDEVLERLASLSVIKKPGNFAVPKEKTREIPDSVLKLVKSVQPVENPVALSKPKKSKVADQFSEAPLCLQPVESPVSHTEPKRSKVPKFLRVEEAPVAESKLDEVFSSTDTSLEGIELELPVPVLDKGTCCFFLHGNTWHAGQVHDILYDDLVTVKNFTNQQFIGINPKAAVLSIAEIPSNGVLAVSAVKLGEAIAKEALEKNEENAELCDIHKEQVMEGEEIKSQEKTIEQALPRKYSGGQSCMARLEEDDTWYQAQVLDLQPQESYNVLLVHYGNEVKVKEEDIVASVENIPEGAEVDKFVLFPKSSMPVESPEKKQSTVKKTGSSWEEGDACVARWKEDGVWYRAIVEEDLGRGDFYVTFIDYGNDAVVSKDSIVRAVAEISEGEAVDENVLIPQEKTSTTEEEKRPVHAEAQIATSTQSPKELVCCLCSTVRKSMSRLKCDGTPVCWNCAVKKINSKHQCWRCNKSPVNTSSHLTKDPVLETCAKEFLSTGSLTPSCLRELRTSSSSLMQDPEVTSTPLPLDLLALRAPGSPRRLVAREELTIPGLQGPMGLTLCPATGELLVVCREQEQVLRYTREGQLLGSLKPGRPFRRPTDILRMACEQLVVRDEQGLQLFNRAGLFLRYLGKETDSCFGLAEDEEGRLITINCNEGGVTRHVTAPGQCDVFFIDVAEDKVVKRIELIDVVEPAEKEWSKFRSLAYHAGKLYLVDQGMHRIFLFYTEDDGEETALVFGEPGSGPLQFKAPSCLAVDDQGTCLVVDTRNHRIQLLDSRHSYAGTVQVEGQLGGPTGIFLDKGRRELWLSDFTGQKVARYRLGD